MELGTQEAQTTGLYQGDRGVRGPGEEIPQEAVPKTYSAEAELEKWKPVY